MLFSDEIAFLYGAARQPLARDGDPESIHLEEGHHRTEGPAIATRRLDAE